NPTCTALTLTSCIGMGTYALAHSIEKIMTLAKSQFVGGGGLALLAFVGTERVLNAVWENLNCNIKIEDSNLSLTKEGKQVTSYTIAFWTALKVAQLTGVISSVPFVFTVLGGLALSIITVYVINTALVSDNNRILNN
ncbi:MAG: hypothetical protein P0S94_00205, partial [Simkaniaceae bacterium]|nr:hypothetical protein [Simkaniaceae bacterium]